MSENLTKDVKVVDNTQWKERHQFVLSANGNIICQRYFKVNGFNPHTLHSVELYETIRDIVGLIKGDLASKSRVYTAVTMNKRSKLTGFYKGEELSLDDAILAYGDNYEGEVELSNMRLPRKRLTILLLSLSLVIFSMTRLFMRRFGTEACIRNMSATVWICRTQMHLISTQTQCV